MSRQFQCLCPECHVAAKEPERCPLSSDHADFFDRVLQGYRRDGLPRASCLAHAGLLGRVSSRWPRLEHAREFCRRMGVRLVGVATCSMFMHEAHFVRDYFYRKGIQAVVASCKVGAHRLEDQGITGKELSYDYHVCNPLGQAALLNEHSTEANLILGLCIPHDMLFAWASEAPCITVFTKEHLSRHAPYSTVRLMADGWRFPGDEA